MSKLVRSLKNVAGGYSSAQVLVRNATSNDPTGPTKYDMEEIASYSYQSQTEFMEIMDMLDRRLNDKGKNWRHIAKSLTVLDYLVRFGSEKCVLWAKDNIYIVKTLREFIHFDEADKDQGAIIRVKAKELVSLLRDDERLKQERQMAKRSKRGRFNDFDDDDGDDGDYDSDRRRNRRRDRDRDRDRGRDEPYDEDLQRALELSRMTAEEEANRAREAENDPDLDAAIKLSLEEEEMRKQQHNSNLLDLNEPQYQQQQQQQPQFFMTTGYYQQPQQQQPLFDQQTQQYGQYDMFGNPIQNPMETGFYDQQAYQQQQQQQQQNQFTGFNYGQPQQPQQQQQQPQQQQEPLQPLKTGSNNPFALNAGSNNTKGHTQTLNDLAEEQQNQQQYQQFQQQAAQPQFYTQPTAPLKQQNTSSSRFNETHELNDLLSQGTGLDTFGNTGATRIPHQHTKTQNFINSSGTGYRQTNNDQHRVSSNATGNPFLNTGIGYQQQTQQQVSPQRQQPINVAYTGYGFGNAQPQQQQQQHRGNDGPSLIDI